MIAQVIVLGLSVMATLIVAQPPGAYGPGPGPAYGPGPAPAYGQGGYDGRYAQAPGYERPMPFDFGYNVQDEYGNSQFRQETGDANGVVQGSYGYTDAYGVYRQVHYIADHNGFRAVVKSNEPGLGQANPADVEYQVDAPPQSVYAGGPPVRGGPGGPPPPARGAYRPGPPPPRVGGRYPGAPGAPGSWKGGY